ncbi:MAG: peptide-methionine (S)-S-oxide reductase MsrA [Actinobacteria bacterium]|nr:peptide-methionine (S)-S-oxide reductase MsrA [Actinomycetota bacterium]
MSSEHSGVVVDAAALPGRATPVTLAPQNLVTGNPMTPPFPEGFEVAIFGSGCFWGAEEYFWQVPGVWTTAVGYGGGTTPNPSYDEVCSGRTGHAEVAFVVHDPMVVSYDELLAVFFETHDPTQGMRQGNDVGTQYRSIVLTTSNDQQRAAEAGRRRFGDVLAGVGRGPITTTVEPLEGRFFYAEDWHQQYLAKNPHGYRCHAATGLRYPTA